MTFKSTHILGTVLVTLALVSGVLWANTLAAQIQSSGGPRKPDEVITIETGDVFEIMSVSDDPRAKTVWILMQDRTFIEAAQNKIFRTRQVLPGDYLLDGSIDEPMVGSQTRRLFLLRILPRAPKDPSQNPSTEILKTFPRTELGGITLPENLHVVKFEPDPAQSKRFAIITDANAGQAAPDNLDTYSFAEASPLYMWFGTPRDRTMEVAIERSDNTIWRQTIALTIGEPESIVQNQGIVASVLTDGKVRFALEQPPAASQPLLVLWEFGDGGQSMRTSPTHKYTKDGTYTIRVSVRNVTTGEVTSSTETTIQVTGTQGTGSTSSEASSVAAASSSSAPAVVDDGPSFFATAIERLNSGFARTILMVVGIIVILGLILIVINRLLKRSKLDKTLEAAESTLLKQKSVQEIIDSPAAPMQVKRAPKEESKGIEEERNRGTEEKSVPETESSNNPTPTPNPEPIIDEAAAPSWLKKGLSKGTQEPRNGRTEERRSRGTEEQMNASAELTTASEIEEIKEPKPVSEPVLESPVAEIPTPTPEPTIDESAAPAWLKKGLSTETTQTEPTPTPAPERTPEPEPEEFSLEPDTTEQTTSELQPDLSAVASVKEEPAAMITPTPAPATATPNVAPKTDEREEARKEREREKKRLKRQRYRENLKKRRQEKKGVQGEQGIKGVQEKVIPVSPAPTPKEVSVPEEVIKKLSKTEIVKAPEPVKAPEVVPTPELPAAKPEKELPPAQPKNELPAAQPNSELPAAQPSAELPAVPEPAPNPSPSSNPPDEDIQFIIRADDVGNDSNDNTGKMQ